ncbi:MAG: helix-turn-helix domain containing protein [Candidatus Woesebacteria bacterium]|nr:helix-turn-helix domain containing protein [Candidatus Woesebacteria bacterium]
MPKLVQKIEAIRIRRTGKSIRSIAKKLNVSASSVSSWCRDIRLTAEQEKVLDTNSRNPYYAGRGVYLNKLKRRTNSKINRLQKIGIKKIGILNKRELFLTGAALYWAEGFKKDSQAGLGSLDPNMIKFYIKWLKICFGYQNNDLIFRVTANVSHKHRIREIEKYWSKLLNVPIVQFQKPFFQDVKWKKTYEHPNEYFGVLRVKVRKSKDFLREIYGFIDGLRLNT